MAIYLRRLAVSIIMTYPGCPSIKPGKVPNLLHSAVNSGPINYSQEWKPNPSVSPTFAKSSTPRSNLLVALSCSPRSPRLTMGNSSSWSSKDTWSQVRPPQRQLSSFLMTSQWKKCSNWRPSNYLRSSTTTCRLSSIKLFRSTSDSRRSTLAPCTDTS